MSATEILAELEKLSPGDLRRVRRKLVDLAEQNEDVALCDAVALEAAQMLDRMETEDGQR